jgi:DNA helicase-2/ATP-dependent DNA helicase PcrA
VFLVGLEENLFPSQLSINSRTELEEERRLFYVAVTRAEKTCTISYASSRFQWGNLVSSEPSRFIAEINQDYLNFENPYGSSMGGGRSLNSGRPVTERGFVGGLNKTTTAPSAGSLKSLSDLSSKPATSEAMNLDLKVGYNVEHDRFGKGKVTKLEGTGVDKKATIFFPHAGAKTLLLRFAKLTVLED